MNVSFESISRRMKYYLATFPIFGRDHYERMNERLERQIKIREAKRQMNKPNYKKKQLFLPSDSKYSIVDTFFDNR